jgi:hypothetical protein
MTKLFEPSDDNRPEKPAARLVRPGRERRSAPVPTPARPAEPRPEPRAARAPAEADPVPRQQAARRAASPPTRREPRRAERDPVTPPPAVGVEPTDALGEPATTPPRRLSLPSVNWRTLLVVLGGLALVVSVGRGLIGVGGGDSDAIETTGPGVSTGQGQRGAAAVKPKRPARVAEPVSIDGSAIRPAGTLLTLNPALAQPGALVGVSGTGFDPRSTVDVGLSVKGTQGSTNLGTFKVDKNGSLNAQVTMPQRLSGGTAVVTARQRNSDKVATAEALGASGIGFVALGEGQETGEPGDTITLSARGFSPGEKINVFWGRASGEPATTLTADESGGVGEASVRVGTGAVGNVTLVLVGAESGTTATAPFFLLGLYPTVAASPFAVKAREVLNISGSAFAPDERVMVFLNASSGTPLTTARADAQGNVGGIGFEVPYGLRGPQSLVLVGELSRASVSSGFEILQYTPSAQPSTYGGSPGTTFSFYATGFGPDEVVEVYLGRGQGNPGELVTAFRVDERGDANAAGSYTIQAGQQGKLSFTLVGRQSLSQTVTTFSALPATGPVELPPQPKYSLPPHLRVDTPSSPSPETPAPKQHSHVR